ncbi:FUSC family protein [Rhodococcus spelaei]|uniref:FUSC family protein n=1 Tax=Rhodococcus spelaei TaxID=2546320 RepID=A0A541BLZ0_9NOCA|nr:FUSC family protein [Rhodococcus spelaei]TQF73338.1 FUSC family protein [Rhodococcus spelaei]
MKYIYHGCVRTTTPDASVRPDAAANRLRQSRGALAHSVSVSTWRSALEVRPADATVAASMRVGIAAALVFVGCGLLDLRQYAGFAVLGALASAFARHEPLVRVAAKVTLVGALLVVFVAGGGLLALAHPPMWAEVAFMSVGAAVAAAAVSAFRIAGPGPVILVFAATAAVSHVTAPGDLVGSCLAAAIGSTVGLLAAAAPLLVLPLGPARLAVARALAAVAALERGASPAPSSGGAAGEVAGPARAAIAHAREKLALSGARGAASWHHRDLVALLDEAEAAVDEWATGDSARLRDVVRHEAELRKVKRRSTIFDSSASVRALALPRPEGFLTVGRAGVRSPVVLGNAMRIGLASVCAGWFAAAVGLDHPLWASMGAMAAMQGVTYALTVQRGIQRLLGNVGGAVVAAVLIGAGLGYWQTVVAIVVLQVTAELTAARNYALTSLAVTPMALLMVGLGSDISPEIGVSRVVDTLVGVAVGVIVAAVTISRSDRQHLPASPAADAGEDVKIVRT